MLRRATSVFAGNEVSAEDSFRWGWLVPGACTALWDDESYLAINARQLQLARDAGALARLPIDLTALAVYLTRWGDFARAAEAIAEVDAVTEATATRIAPYGAMMLAAFRGREPEASTLIESAIKDATAGGQGTGVQTAQWVAAILFNGRSLRGGAGRSRQASEGNISVNDWALTELIEASTRTGEDRLAADALERLAEATHASDTDWGLGIEARSRALLSEGETAERLYREAIKRLGRTRLRPELARAHLLYGEWLRRRPAPPMRARSHTATSCSSRSAWKHSPSVPHRFQTTGERVHKRTSRRTTTHRAGAAPRSSLATASPTPAIGTRLP
jgi:hypothetical protein